MSSNPFVDTDTDAIETTIEEAIQIVECGTHFNFAGDVEAKRKHYRRKAQAYDLVRQAGYAVLPAPRGLAHIVKTH